VCPASRQAIHYPFLPMGIDFADVVVRMQLRQLDKIKIKINFHVNKCRQE